MHKINKLYLYALVLAAVIVLIPNNIWPAWAAGTSISVQPAITTVTGVGIAFNINITISQVANLTAWDFQLYYPNFLLNATKLKEGPFLRQAGSTSNLTNSFTDFYNATHGRIWFACTLLGQGFGASGDGVLATITFKTKSGGDGILHFGETELDGPGFPIPKIPHTTNDGIVHVIGGTKDVAVTNVTPIKTIIGWGYNLSTKVTVQNQGDYGLSFNVSLYAKRLLAASSTDYIHLYGSDQLGWGLTMINMTSPGPTITVHKGDTVSLTLTAQDVAYNHNFFVDYNGDKNPSQGEPKSLNFSNPYRQTITYQFTAGQSGSFTYYDEYHENVMYGTFVIADPTYVETIEIGKQSIFLDGGASSNLTYVWHTSSVNGKCFYDLSAYAWPLVGEVNLGNNNFTCSTTVTLSIPGDVNGDSHVNIKDASLLGVNWGKHSPPAPANVDINGDGKLDIKDATIIGFNWGKDP